MAAKAGYVDVTGDVTLTFDWEPEGLIVWATSQDADGYLSNADFAGYTGDCGMSIGFADRNGQQCATIAAKMSVAFGPWSDSGRAMRTDCVLVQARNGDPGNATTTIEAVLTGNTVELTVNDTVDMRVHYIAFAGDSMGVASGTLTMPGDGSDLTVTGVPFDPRIGNSLLLCASTINDGSFATGFLYFGMTDGSDTGRNVGLTINYLAVGGAAGSWSGIACGADSVDFSAWTTDGFTLAQGGGGDSQVIAWLLINDLDTINETYRDDGEWPAGSGSVTSPGFQPGLVIFAGSIDGEENTGGQITIGYAWDDDGTIVTATALVGVANVDDQRRWTAMSTDLGEVLLDIEGNPGTQSGQVTLDAFTADGFDWDGAQGAGANQFIYGALGTGPAGLYPQIIRWV